MIQKIIISRLNNIAAIIQQNKIQELVVINDVYQINDIYLGTVQKIFTSINAAFVKLNHHNKSGFIHASDTKSCKKVQNLRNISEAITIKQILLVQIIKEPTKSKGPRLTTNIHLGGKYLILMPFNNTVCIANKIYDENERAYLRALGVLMKPAMMGLLFKDSSRGIKEEALIEDLKYLKEEWLFIQKAAVCKSSPSLLHTDQDIVKKIMSNLSGQQVSSIIVDSKNTFRQLKYLLSKHTNSTKLQLYQQEERILEKFKINQTIYAALKPKVELRGGAYLFIESSEALTVIDVNSGSFNPSRKSQEAILRTNCLAATEIAYQLKIRNINGVIIIDFIDMKTDNDQLQLLEHFNKSLRIDSARPQIVQLSELGLVELTRRRREQSLAELFAKQTLLIKPLLTTSPKDKSVLETKWNVNTIFFKKCFCDRLELRSSNLATEAQVDLSIILFPLISSSIIPLHLYHFVIDKRLDCQKRKEV
jgi:ribonuclease E